MAAVATARTNSWKVLIAQAEMDRETDFEAVYTLHFRDVYRYVLGLTRSADETDDLTAETFERAFRAWKSSEAIPPLPLPWLFLTARRLVTDRWRRATRFASLRRHVRGRNPAGGERRIEFWLWFDALAEALSDRQREVLLLRYQRDLTDADIAMIMGLSPSGVRSLVARALAALRAHPELL